MGSPAARGASRPPGMYLQLAVTGGARSDQSWPGVLAKGADRSIKVLM